MKPHLFDNTDTGAPTLNNVNGAGIAVLLACLVTGYNIKTVTSIVVASGVATATAASHGYSATYGKLVKISGAPEAALNGNHQPSGVTTNTFTYPAVGVADGTYTGTIEARRAPLGFAEEFNNTLGTKSVFRRTAVEALAPKLVVDDSVGGSMMRVRMVESATGVNTVTGLAPTDAQINGGGYWQKGGNDATAKKWAVVGNDRFFYFLTQIGATNAFVFYFFGDGVAYENGDAWFTLLSTQINTVVSGSPTFGGSTPKAINSAPAAVDAIYSSRGRLPVANTAELTAVGGANIGSAAFGNNSLPSEITHPTVPIANNALLIGPGYVRGELPGFASPMANFTTKAPLQEIIAGPDVYIAVPFNAGGPLGCALLCLSRDWH